MKLALLLLTASLAILAQDTASNLATVSGTVTSADGQPIAGARVSSSPDMLFLVSSLPPNAPVQPPRGGPPQPGGGPPQRPVNNVIPPPAVSAADGSFKLEGLQPGSYRIVADADGYIRQELGSRPGETRTGTLLSIKLGDRIANLNVRMVRQRAITGRVTTSNGDPAPDIPVHAVRAVYTNGLRRYREAGNSGTTDTRGDFRIYGLPPGQYFVFANAPADSARPDDFRRTLLPTYAPNALRVSEAIPITVSADADALADVRLREDRQVTVRGRVVAQGDRPPEGATVLVMPDADTPVLQGSGSGDPAQLLARLRSSRNSPPYAAIAQADAEGSFSISVLPGAHRLIAFGGTRMQLQFNSTEGTRSIGMGGGGPTSDDAAMGAADLNVGRDEVDGVTLVLRPGGDLTTSATVDGKPFEEYARTRFANQNMPPQALATAMRLPVTLIAADGVAYGSQTSLPPGQTPPSAQRISPGRYLVNVNSANVQWYVASMKLSGADITRQPLDFAGGSATLEIALSTDFGVIGGDVAGSDGKPVSGARISAWPVTPDASRHDGGSFATTSSTDAAFSFSRLAPGEYFAAAFEDLPDPGLAQYTPFLDQFASKAKRVKVDANGNASVSLEVISADDAQRVFATLR